MTETEQPSPPASTLYFPIASPCVAVCKMDDARQYCIGCMRTIEEIKNWGRSDDDYKLAVLQQLRNRRRAAGRTSERDSRPRRRDMLQK